MIDGLVSIITPLYNCEKFLAETIDSVVSQTYQKWELLLIDDFSTDGSATIAKEYAANDVRIKYYKLKENCGSAIARNFGLECAEGEYIAYLDSDDLWKPNKLEFQINYMKSNNAYFTCSNYEMMSENGKDVTKIVKVPKKTNYGIFLRTTLIHTSGIMGNISIIDKKLFEMPNVRRGQDSATWAQVLKAGYDCYGVDLVLHSYRRVRGSLSSNKFTAIKRTWFWYRKIEKLNFFYSLYCFVGHSIHAVLKRL